VSTPFNISPIPVENSGQIHFSLEEAAEVNIRVVDINGRTVHTLINQIAYNAGRHTKDFTLSNLPSGLYLVEFNQNGKKSIQKMLVK